jgi:hypothetical protein
MSSGPNRQFGCLAKSPKKTGGAATLHAAAFKYSQIAEMTIPDLTRAKILESM